MTNPMYYRAARTARRETGADAVVVMYFLKHDSVDPEVIVVNGNALTTEEELTEWANNLIAARRRKV